MSPPATAYARATRHPSTEKSAPKEPEKVGSATRPTARRPGGPPSHHFQGHPREPNRLVGGGHMSPPRPEEKESKKKAGRTGWKSRIEHGWPRQRNSGILTEQSRTKREGGSGIGGDNRGRTDGTDGRERRTGGHGAWTAASRVRCPVHHHTLPRTSKMGRSAAACSSKSRRRKSKRRKK